MRDNAVGRQAGPEPQRGKHLVGVVVLDDLPHSLDGERVGVRIPGVHVVQRARAAGVSIGRREVHRHRKVQLRAEADARRPENVKRLASRRRRLSVKCRTRRSKTNMVDSRVTCPHKHEIRYNRLLSRRGSFQNEP